ncbi:unnamed protein product [Sympodiomycopsis kandeliae]
MAPTAGSRSFPYVNPGAPDHDTGSHDLADSGLEPSFSTWSLHADEPDIDRDPNHPIAPNIVLSTTFRAPHPTAPLSVEPYSGWTYNNPQSHIYSRYTSDTRGRAEQVLSKVMNAHAILYPSGLNAAYAIALHVQPTVIALRRGYFGCHESFKLYMRSKGDDVKFIDLDEEYPTEGKLLVWLETPLNPSGEARDIQYYADKAHKAGGQLAIDSTFAPPPLQDPFKQGADLVMHSATKYFGGHSDLLMGVVASQDEKAAGQLWHDRTYMGCTPGNMESYLLLRSLRTLDIRVKKQSQTATELASWLWSLSPNNKQADPNSLTDALDKEILSSKIVGWVSHSSLQPRSKEERDPETGKPHEAIGFNPSHQMPGGHAPTFAIRIAGGKHNGGARAAWLPHQTRIWIPATSLGGVESLIEHRINAEPTEDPGTIRLSVGLEDVEDLKQDIRLALQRVLQIEKEGKLVWPGNVHIAKQLGRKEV